MSKLAPNLQQSPPIAMQFISNLPHLFPLLLIKLQARYTKKKGTMEPKKGI
jgi:hypothetical protein